MIYVESCTKTENLKLAICKSNVKFCLSYDKKTYVYFISWVGISSLLLGEFISQEQLYHDSGFWGALLVILILNRVFRQIFIGLRTLLLSLNS